MGGTEERDQRAAHPQGNIAMQRHNGATAKEKTKTKTRDSAREKAVTFALTAKSRHIV